MNSHKPPPLDADEADTILIAQLRSDLSAKTAELERVRAELEDVRGDCKAAEDGHDRAHAAAVEATARAEKAEGERDEARALQRECRSAQYVAENDAAMVRGVWKVREETLESQLREARGEIERLEAALHEIADYSEQFVADDEDGDERMYKINLIADGALALLPSNQAPVAIETLDRKGEPT